MKRWLYFLLILAMPVCLTGCSQKNQKVPDRILEWQVEDYLKYNRINYNDTYTKYDMQTSHSYDKQTKTDTVRIKLSVYYPRYVALSSYEGTYKYNKDKEEWEFLRGNQWGDLQVESFTMSDAKDDWKLAMRQAGFRHVEDAEDPAEEDDENWYEYWRERITQSLQDEVPSASLEDFWLIGAEDDEEDGYSMRVTCMMFQNEQAASSVYKAYEEEFSDPDDYYISSTAKGKNYEYTELSVIGSMDSILIVCNEKSVFLINFFEAEWVPYDLLYEVGFVYDYHDEWS